MSQDAQEIVARLRHQNAEHDFDAHEAAADLIEQQSDRIKAIRAATIEDCAKLAERYEETAIYPTDETRMSYESGVINAVDNISHAIRALADKDLK